MLYEIAVPLDTHCEFVIAAKLAAVLLVKLFNVDDTELIVEFAVAKFEFVVAKELDTAAIFVLAVATAADTAEILEFVVASEAETAAKSEAIEDDIEDNAFNVEEFAGVYPKAVTIAALVAFILFENKV